MPKVYVSININAAIDLNKTLEILEKTELDTVFMAIVERIPFEKCERREKVLKRLQDVPFPKKWTKMCEK